MSTQQELQTRFEDFLVRIDDAKENVNSGILGDFEKLNAEILEVCTQTQSAPPETAKALQKHMGRVILKLDELTVSITAYKDKLQEKQ